MGDRDLLVLLPHAERKLGGWLYTMVRPNIGTVAGGAWVWDDSAWLPWEVLYSANYSALQLPPGTDLADVALPTGVTIRAVEPGMVYELGYHDGDRLSLALRFEGVMPPEPLTAVPSTASTTTTHQSTPPLSRFAPAPLPSTTVFGSASHFDQVGRVTGHIVLHGERITIDCLAMRDRTWGRRPEDRPRQSAYVTAAASPDEAFLAVTNVRNGTDLVSYGFLRRDGRTVSLAGGERRVERSAEHGWVTKVELDAVDAEGRQLAAVGHPVSRIILNRHTFIDVNSLIRWDVGGQTAWGEDQDMWPVHAWSKFRRESAPIVNQEGG